MARLGLPSQWSGQGTWNLLRNFLKKEASHIPAFLNAWGNYIVVGEYTDCEYFQASDGKINIRGLVKNGASIAFLVSSTIFILPEGMRPAERELFTMLGAVSGTQAQQRVDVLPNGEVVYVSLATGIPEYVPLTQISFYPKGI